MAETMEVLNPATEEVLGVVPNCSAEDVDVAVESAKAALPGWLDATPGERSEILLGLARVLEENSDELAGIESAEVSIGEATIQHDGSVSLEQLREAIAVAGYAVVDGEEKRGRTLPIF